jgi:hypothetical protein
MSSFQSSPERSRIDGVAWPIFNYACGISHNTGKRAIATLTDRRFPTMPALARNIFIVLKVITEFGFVTQRIFSFAPHKQQKFLMRGNACIVAAHRSLDPEGRAS